MNAPTRAFVAERAFNSDAAAEPRLEVVVAKTLNDLMQVFALRAMVYMGEQRCPYDEEYDGNDMAGATHLILRRDGEPIGTLRMRWFADFAKMERVAIAADHRGRRANLALVRAAFDLAARKGYRKILGHAQARLRPFWSRHFKARARPGRDQFVFSDHDYVEIEADLDPRPDALHIDSDPMVILRPEGSWEEPGVLDRSSFRPATNPV